MKLITSSCIWNKGAHNAFTDLCEYNGQYFCCFRQAQKHVSSDGIIQVLVSDNLTDWRLSSTVRENNFDLRDPKLSVTPSGKLGLLYGKVQRNKHKTTFLQSAFCQSTNGITWSASKLIAKQSQWLWRLSWHQGQAYGISYGEQKTMLYKGQPNGTLDCIDDNLFSKQRYGKGYPNESDIVFLPDNSALAILRRDADTCTAQLGRSKYPYTQWQWFDLKQYIGGPALIRYNDQVIVAGRSFSSAHGCKTCLWQVNLQNNQVEKLLTLPSTGDTSYPGLLIKDTQLIVSYYSEHQANKSSIFLAKVQLKTS
ncbi:hypothetical protein [Thalassotalea sp. G2M2-11]|uniref:hypothetical protein n=1 Tax=Thalassotalea sp. G2M2-11 TaxID=2787627 RepID=UPI0019D2DE4B|nr:hypothetical protein [Thalassotalea sp. G2M2-11]